jgi:hypothetical protein
MRLSIKGGGLDDYAGKFAPQQASAIASRSLARPNLVRQRTRPGTKPRLASSVIALGPAGESVT